MVVSDLKEITKTLVFWPCKYIYNRWLQGYEREIQATMASARDLLMGTEHIKSIAENMKSFVSYGPGSYEPQIRKDVLFLKRCTSAGEFLNDWLSNNAILDCNQRNRQLRDDFEKSASNVYSMAKKWFDADHKWRSSLSRANRDHLFFDPIQDTQERKDRDAAAEKYIIAYQEFLRDYQKLRNYLARVKKTGTLKK